MEDQASVAAAKRKISAERDKRLNEVMQRAASIGAIVVTENALPTFMY